MCPRRDLENYRLKPVLCWKTVRRGKLLHLFSPRFLSAIVFCDLGRHTCLQLPGYLSTQVTISGHPPVRAVSANRILHFCSSSLVNCHFGSARLGWASRVMESQPLPACPAVPYHLFQRHTSFLLKPSVFGGGYSPPASYSRLFKVFLLC